MRPDTNAALFTGIVTRIIEKEKSVHVIVRQTRFIKELEDGKREFEYNRLRCVARGATAEYIKGGGIQERDPVEVYSKIRQDEWIDEENKKQRAIKFMIERIVRTSKRVEKKEDEAKTKDEAKDEAKNEDKGEEKKQ